MGYLELWADEIKSSEDRMLGDINRHLSEFRKRMAAKDLGDIIKPLRDCRLEDYKGTRTANIDGGQGMKELYGIAVFLVRASSYNFVVDKSKPVYMRKIKIDYLPQDRELSRKIDLLRANMEVEMCLEASEGAEYVFWDGSLASVPTFIRTDETEELHDVLCFNYRKLLGECISKNKILVGVSEDTHSRRFLNRLRENDKIYSDSNFLEMYAREKGIEAPWVSETFEYKVESKDAAMNRFKSFYLKANKRSAPLRIDVQPHLGDADIAKLQGLVLCLSQNPSSYGYPLPLYYAHLDAKLPEELMQRTYERIAGRLLKDNALSYYEFADLKRRDKRPE